MNLFGGSKKVDGEFIRRKSSTWGNSSKRSSLFSSRGFTPPEQQTPVEIPEEIPEPVFLRSVLNSRSKESPLESEQENVKEQGDVSLKSDDDSTAWSEEVKEEDIDNLKQNSEILSPQSEDTNNEDLNNKPIGELENKYERQGDIIAARTAQQPNSSSSELSVQDKVESVTEPTVTTQGDAVGGTLNQDIEQSIQQKENSTQESGTNILDPKTPRTSPEGSKTGKNPNSNKWDRGGTKIAQINITQTVTVPPESAETAESSINYTLEKLGYDPKDPRGCNPGQQGIFLLPKDLNPNTKTRDVQVTYGLCGDSTENIRQQTDYFETSDRVTKNNDPETTAELNAVLQQYAQKYGGKLEDTPLWKQLSTIYGKTTEQSGSGELTKAILYTLVEQNLIDEKQVQERIEQKRASRNDVNALNKNITPLNKQVALILDRDVTYNQFFESIITDIAQSEKGAERIQSLEDKVNEIAGKFEHTKGEAIDNNAILNAVLVYWESKAQQAVGGTSEQQPILQEYFENLPAEDPNPNKGTQKNIRDRALNIFAAVTNHSSPKTEAEQSFYRALRNSVMISYHPDIAQQFQPENIKARIEKLDKPVLETLNAAGSLDSIPQEKYLQYLKVGRELEKLNPAELQTYKHATTELNWDVDKLENSVQTYQVVRKHLEKSLDDSQSRNGRSNSRSSKSPENSLNLDSLLTVDKDSKEGEPNWWQILKDLIASSLGSYKYAPEVLGELWEEIKENWPLFVGTLVALIGAEQLVIALAASPDPTFLTKALAVALQGLILAVYGVGFAVSLTSGLEELTTWFNTAVAANGDPAAIEEASKSFLRGIGNLLMAILSAKAFQKNLSPARLKALNAMLQRVRGRNNPGLPDGSPTIGLIRDPKNPDRYILSSETKPSSDLPPSNQSQLPPGSQEPLSPITNPPAPRRTPGTPPVSSGTITPSQKPKTSPEESTNTTPNLSPTPENPSPQPAPQPTPEPAPFAEPQPRQKLDVSQEQPGTVEKVEPSQSYSASSTEAPTKTPVNLEPLGVRLRNVLGLSLSTEQLQQASEGKLLTEKQIEAIVRSAKNWQEILDNYLVYPDLLDQIILFREKVVSRNLIEVIKQNPEFQTLDIYLGNQQIVKLGQLVDMVVAGSADRTSDYDVTFSAGAGKEYLEILAVKAFNEIFRKDWGRESGVVFDTNVYTSGHMRPDAFKGDGAKLNLVNKLVKKLETVKDGVPTAQQRTEVNDSVARINGLKDITVPDSLPQLEISNFEAFSQRVKQLQVLVERTVRKQYTNSKEQYGAGQEFDEQASVMSLVHMKEFWHQQGSGKSEWTYLEERMTSDKLPEAVKNVNQERLDSANQTHSNLVEERQRKIAQLQEKIPESSQANLEMRASNELYVEYLQLVRNQLNNIRAAEKAGTPAERIESMRLRLQELQSKALFFANEAYMTPIAAEQVVLNQQIGLKVKLPTDQYLASINEQTAFIGEQVGHYENNFGRALWKTSKYADRVLNAIQTIYKQTGEKVPSKDVMKRVEILEPLVKTLLKGIKKDTELKSVQKDEAAVNLARKHPSALGSSSSEWGRLLLDLQIDVNLQVEEYLIKQQNSSDSP